MVIVLEEVALDDLIKVDISYGKITQVLGSIIQRLSRADADRDDLRSEFNKNKEHVGEKLEEIEKRLMKLEEGKTEVDLSPSVDALRADVDRLAAELAQQNEAADASLRALIENHERRIQSAEDRRETSARPASAGKRASLQSAGPLPNAPECIPGVDALCESPGSVAVTWVPSAVPGVTGRAAAAAVVTGYQVKWRNAAGASGTVDYTEAAALADAVAHSPINAPRGSTRRGVVHGLVPGVMHTFRVCATNAYGTSLDSAQSDAIEPYSKEEAANEAAAAAAAAAPSSITSDVASTIGKPPRAGSAAAGPGAAGARSLAGSRDSAAAAPAAAAGSDARSETGSNGPASVRSRPNSASVGSARGRPGSAAKSRPLVAHPSVVAPPTDTAAAAATPADASAAPPATRSGSDAAAAPAAAATAPLARVDAPPPERSSPLVRRMSVLKDGVVQSVAAPVDVPRPSGSGSPTGPSGVSSSLADRLQQFLTDHERRLRQMEADAAAATTDAASKHDLEALEEALAGVTARVAALERALEALNARVAAIPAAPEAAAAAPAPAPAAAPVIIHADNPNGVTQDQLALLDRKMQSKASASDVAALSAMLRSLQESISAIPASAPTTGTGQVVVNGASAHEVAAIRATVEALDRVKVPAAQQSAERADHAAAATATAVNGVSGRVDTLQAVVDALSRGDGIGGVEQALAALRREKADVGTVASMAPRTYVDGELDKLRDALDDALHGLRDDVATSLERALQKLKELVDSKASSSELRKALASLTERVEEETSPDGLIGVRGFRCLGCNRKMDSLRPRPAGMNPTPASATPLGVRQRMMLNGGALPPATSDRPRSANVIPR